MDQDIHDLYWFLFACGGNWRNAVHISCRCCAEHRSCEGFLLSVDASGKPVLMEVSRFRKLSGETIDPSECVGQMDRQGFETLYGRYLMWTVSEPSRCSLRQLTRSGALKSKGKEVRT